MYSFVGESKCILAGKAVLSETLLGLKRMITFGLDQRTGVSFRSSPDLCSQNRVGPTLPPVTVGYFSK